MQIDDALTTEALSLADGTDVHDIVGMVAMYRSIVREGSDATDLERELPSFVARKRLQHGRFWVACER